MGRLAADRSQRPGADFPKWLANSTAAPHQLLADATISRNLVPWLLFGFTRTYDLSWSN
jgi:hypothetical protein